MSEHAAVEKQADAVRVGVCGVGRAGWGMIHEEIKRRPDIRIVAGADVMPERAAELAQAVNGRAYTSLEQLLNDKDVELVVIATRSLDHAPMAMAALRAGKHVLVEKPMARTLQEADELLAVARQSKGTLLVRHNRRFDPPLLVAKEVIGSGKLGPVFRIQLRQGGYNRRADWQTLLQYGGGQLLNWGPHLVDWAMQLIGTKAKDIWSDLKCVAAAGDAEDHVKIMIRGENGVIADIEISGGAAIPQPGWHILGKYGALVIDGEKASLKYYDPRALPPITADHGTPPRGNAFATAETIPWVQEEFDVRPKHQPEFWHEVYETIRHGRPFPVSLDEARENMRVIDAARRGSAFEQ